ncbi:MAG: glycerol-3-phosphate 1-O-acyltransferase PlsY [Proteobacteria bacterium]|nr:glycerol-3-phosphate 1-O-acyltransferase PlsY [Pseudomonadota bacterium]MBU4296863.1 glycerol-3-phosphate 1-O-acyltransferase PlsY [Pseudomonadota bacterium]MCG2746371.1 glycerol-3-phosphate 1-O-acyltransferase PlsY [Desulfobulbaceae bacterium]
MDYFLIIISYLVGSIPFGLLLGKLAGIDVRRDGSGNIGATNVSRLLGKKIGAVTLLLDAGKGLLPMAAAGALQFEQHIVMLCGAAAFIGHLFPLYLRFRGGKGVATALGIFLYLSPLALLICATAFFAAVFLSGFVSLGSLMAAALMPVVVFFHQGSSSCFYLAVFVSLLIWIKHRSNIIRLMHGEEKSWKKKKESEV